MRKLVIVFFFLLFIIFTGYLAYNYSQSERFGDETAHFIGGHLVLSGKKLYQDLQFNHLPLPYFFSAFAELVTHPKNLYLFIARQREMVFAYSTLWNLLYFVFFGPVFFFFTLLFEISKYFFQGYKVLNESIATYPLVFMIGVMIRSFLYHKTPSRLALAIFSAASFIVAFSLFPLWIVVALIYCLLFYSLRKKKPLWKYAIIPCFVLTLIFSYFVSFPHLLKESIINNFVYFLPNSGGHISFLRMIFLPFASFLPPYHPAKLLVALFVVFTGISIFFALKKHVGKKYLLIIVFLTLTNFFRVDDYTFGNFHLLPWVAALLTIEIIWIKHTKHILSTIKIVTVLIFVLYLFLVPGKQLFSKKNLSNEFYINYSESESYGNALMAIKQNTDRALVIPNDTLIYWSAKMSPPTKVLEYYPWVYHIPEYNQELIGLFKLHPPEFVVNMGLDPMLKTEQFILPVLETRYQKLYHVGTPSKLYVLKTKVSNISQSQWDRLKEMLYTKTQYE